MKFLKKFLILIFLLSLGHNNYAINLSADLFNYDKNKVAETFKELNSLEQLILENPEMTIEEISREFSAFRHLFSSRAFSPAGIVEISAPGKIPSFWWAFTLSAIGSYTLYGAVAGPIAVGVVYFSTDKDKKETKKAIYGCLTGTVVGLGVFYITKNLL